MTAVHIETGKESMKKHLDATWQELQTWIKDAIGSDFRWRIRPRDTHSNRRMIVSLILNGIRRNNGVFPDREAFIERV